MARVLRAELHHLGAASIRLELERRGERTRVVTDEVPVEGVVDAVHTQIGDAALEQGNTLALDRLRRLAETRS